MTGRKQCYREKPLKLKLISNNLERHNDVENAFSPVFQWFKTCWCLKEVFRTILCLEGVLFYFSFCTASIWNKSPWVCYILKSQLKTLIGSGPTRSHNLGCPVHWHSLTRTRRKLFEIKRIASGVACSVTTPGRGKIWVTKQSSSSYHQT